jgi:hypothetical protein
LKGQESTRIEQFTVGVADGPADGLDLADPTTGFLGDVERIPEVELLFGGGPLTGTRYPLKRTITLIGRSSQ